MDPVQLVEIPHDGITPTVWEIRFEGKLWATVNYRIMAESIALREFGPDTQIDERPL